MDGSAASPRVVVEVDIIPDPASSRAADRKPVAKRFRSRADARDHLAQGHAAYELLPDDGLDVTGGAAAALEPWTLAELVEKIMPMDLHGLRAVIADVHELAPGVVERMIARERLDAGISAGRPAPVADDDTWTREVTRIPGTGTSGPAAEPDGDTTAAEPGACGECGQPLIGHIVDAGGHIEACLAHVAAVSATVAEVAAECGEVSPAETSRCTLLPLHKGRHESWRDGVRFSDWVQFPATPFPPAGALLDAVEAADLGPTRIVPAPLDCGDHLDTGALLAPGAVAACPRHGQVHVISLTEWAARAALCELHGGWGPFGVHCKGCRADDDFDDDTTAELAAGELAVAEVDAARSGERRSDSAVSAYDPAEDVELATVHAIHAPGFIALQHQQLLGATIPAVTS